MLITEGWQRLLAVGGGGVEWVDGRRTLEVGCPKNVGRVNVGLRAALVSCMIGPGWCRGIGAEGDVCGAPDD